MNLHEWIRGKYWGSEERVGSEIRIVHPRGDTSSLWPRSPELRLPAELRGLGYLYDEVDGADLFSSTFKIAAIEEARSRGGVVIVPSLDHVRDLVREERCRFPRGTTPFMQQAGIGWYGFNVKTGLILEWDVEGRELTGEYRSLFEVLDEWAEAVLAP